MRFSSARMFHKRGLFEKLKKPFPKKTKQAQPKQETMTKKIGGDKNGGQRVVLAKKEVSSILRVFGSLHSKLSKFLKTRLKNYYCNFFRNEIMFFQ